MKAPIQTKPTNINFVAIVPTLAEAADLWLEAIRCIKPLDDSLIGESPACADTFCINLDVHAKVRNIKTLQHLVRFQMYLEDIFDDIRATPGDYQLPLFSHRGTEGFVYGTASGRAYIALAKNNLGWTVTGAACFMNPWGVQKKLARNFTVSLEHPKYTAEEIAAAKVLMERGEKPLVAVNAG